MRKAIIAAAAAAATSLFTWGLVSPPATQAVPLPQACNPVAIPALGINADCGQASNQPGLCQITGVCAPGGAPLASPGPPAAPAPARLPAPAAPPGPPAAPAPAVPAGPPVVVGQQSPGPVSSWPGGVPADCANEVYAAHYNDFCATAPGGPYPLGENNPYENGTPLDHPILKGH